MTKMLDLGEKAPSFKNLLGADGERYSIASFNDKPVLTVVFSCNHCPYAKAYEERMVSIQRDYASRGVQLVAINSNDEMVKRAKEKGFRFPYLRDGEQAGVVEYGAVCTPHVFAFDKARLLRYRGRIDDSRDPSSVRSHDLRNALDDLLAGREVRVPDTRPFGCSIKWAAD